MPVRFLLLLALLAALVVPTASPSPIQAAPERCFPETDQCVSGRFLGYWETQGGLPVFGYPKTPAQNEVNRDTDQTYMTQWFERNRFELHPENQPPYDVLLGRLGDDLLLQQGRNWQSEPGEPGPKAGCLWFQQTRRNVCNQSGALGFKSYWESHGLECDGRAGSSYAESLALFGLPLTEPKMETNSSGDTVLTQWFERARFEWHPNNPDEYKVLLGLLGNEAGAQLKMTANSGLPGRLLVNSGALYSVAADGSRSRPLQAQLHEHGNGGFAISPDGRRLATRCFSGGTAGVCTMNLDGSAVVRLNEDATAVVQSWSPDGRRLAYVSDDAMGIYVINTDGSGQRLLMAGTLSLMPRRASWSPDSQRIAFQTTYSETAVYVASADGAHLQKIVERGWGPSWSPAGQTIAYISDVDGAAEAYLVNADGSGRKRLTSTADREEQVRWSPDGSRLAVLAVSTVAPGPAQQPPSSVRVMNPANAEVSATVDLPANFFAVSFRWSPDGEYIAAGLACSRACIQKVVAEKVGTDKLLTLAETTRGGQPLDLLAWIP